MDAVVRDPEAQWLLTSKVGDAPLRALHYVEPSDSLHRAAELMSQTGAGSVLVRFPDRLGVLTGEAIRDALALRGHRPEEAVAGLADGAPVSIDASEFLSGALARMNRHHVRWLVVTGGDGAPVGLLDQPDVLELLASHSGAITAGIHQACDLRDLKGAFAKMLTQIATLSRGGMRAEQLGRLATAINTAIFSRVFELVFPAEAHDGLCLIVMGSGGRGEQILPTDQDNALIIDDSIDPATVREACEAFSAALIDIGYAACPGNIMLRNPEWALSETDFKMRVQNWVVRADNADVMNLAIFLDAAPTAGAVALFHDLKREMYDAARGGDAFFARFASAIVAFPPPLRMFSRLRLQRSGEQAGCIDIKKGGVFQIVHGVRSMAFEKRIEEPGTLARIERLIGTGTIERRTGRELGDAFEFLSALRTRVGVEALATGHVPDNYVRPADLTDFERDMLRDSLRVVMRFRELVKQHFRLEMLGF